MFIPLISLLKRLHRKGPAALWPGCKSGILTAGFTLIELMIACAIMGTLAAIATPMFHSYIERVQLQRVYSEIRLLEKEITIFQGTYGRFPQNLAEIGLDKLQDPWGNPYRYLPVEGTPPGKLRKDHFMVPVNSDFDLYSMGKDGKTASPFTAKNSRDDIVRANDGQYLGLVANY
ncbi:MAG: prepilin-type N-terminal cleavage/methylation domain-containing protein [Deltaproteobacteria bacterium]|nr:prepilin-type N-terminal cleavage/methylation domain-containing protein [Deltaproteobacteria bacterium]